MSGIYLSLVAFVTSTALLYCTFQNITAYMNGVGV